jgi:hypothetical protein
MTQVGVSQETPEGTSGDILTNTTETLTPNVAQQTQGVNRVMTAPNMVVGGGQVGAGGTNGAQLRTQEEMLASGGNLGVMNSFGIGAAGQLGNFFPDNAGVGLRGNVNFNQLGGFNGVQLQNVDSLDSLGWGSSSGPSAAVLQGLQNDLGYDFSRSYGVGVNGGIGNVNTLVNGGMMGNTGLNVGWGNNNFLGSNVSLNDLTNVGLNGDGVWSMGMGANNSMGFGNNNLVGLAMNNVAGAQNLVAVNNNGLGVNNLATQNLMGALMKK